MDLVDLQELFKEHDQNKGALLCEPETFQFLCKLERRRIERENRLPVVYVGMFTLVPKDIPQSLSPEPCAAMEQLQGVLLANLRKGDVICRWNEWQIVLFLPGVNLEQAESAMQRISTLFRKTCQPGGMILESSIYPLSPWGT